VATSGKLGMATSGKAAREHDIEGIVAKYKQGAYLSRRHQTSCFWLRVYVHLINSNESWLYEQIGVVLRAGVS
jgi:hypothetical protein